MVNEQTQVHGSTINNYCKMQATYLCKLIYKDPPVSELLTKIGRNKSMEQYKTRSPEKILINRPEAVFSTFV